MNEQQKRRTYEIIAKYVGKETGITIDFEHNACPQADIANKRLILPVNLDEKYLFPGLAALIHEAGHIRWTTFDFKKLVTCQEEFTILNSIEDVRVDLKSFDMLPNIRGFFEKFMEYIKEEKEKIKTPIPIEAQVLVDCIAMEEGFNHFCIGGQKVKDFIRQHDLLHLFRKARYALDSKDFKTAKKIIEDIRKLLYKSKTELQPGMLGPGEKGKGGKEGQGVGFKPGQDGDLDLSYAEARSGKSKEIFKHQDPGAKGHLISAAAFQEQTRQQFSELLNLKVVKTINDGVQLNTDKLTAFLTGDIDELFTESKIQRFKKSKILLVLDNSGSMTSPMIDGQSRKKVLAKTAKGITNILDEIHAIEGINVDYDVRAFGSGYYVLPKVGWEKDYLSRSDGSTCCATAFTKGQQEILKDWTIDGNKMIILMTDGEIDLSQVEQIQRDILKYNEDVRCMIMGVGANPTDDFMQRLCSHNILCEDLADSTVLEVIMAML